jgi:hypothetical protein
MNKMGPEQMNAHAQRIISCVSDDLMKAVPNYFPDGRPDREYHIMLFVSQISRRSLKQPRGRSPWAPCRMSVPSIATIRDDPPCCMGPEQWAQCCDKLKPGTLNVFFIVMVDEYRFGSFMYDVKAVVPPADSPVE